jgi:hypothetical protein
VRTGEDEGAVFELEDCSLGGRQRQSKQVFENSRVKEEENLAVAKFLLLLVHVFAKIMRVAGGKNILCC